MNRNQLALLLAAALIVLSAPAQKPDNLLDLYQDEYQTLRELVRYSQRIKIDPTIDVKFYYIDLVIGVPEPYVGGDVTVRLEPTVAGLTEFTLNLHNSLTVDAITSPCVSFTQDDGLIYLTLDQAYDPGEIIEFTITYHGVPVLAGGYKGLRYHYHNTNEPVIATLSTPYLAHYWFPCNDGPQDKVDSVYVDITVPELSYSGIEIMAVSNGVLEDVIDQGASKTYQWRHRYPVVSYYIMAAVSNYVSFGELFSGNSGESFPLDYYVFNESLASAQQGVAGLPEVIQFFSDVFGMYPFSNEKYGMTQLGFYGAIENQTNTIQNNLSQSWFYTSVHELGHMWFGDMITLADWHHCWLNEGFATYSEALWDEYKYGFQAYKNNMQTNEFWNGGTLILENAADTFNTFQSIFYSKGAYAVHMLRGVLGDTAFFDALMDYTQNPDFRYQNASTEDLRQSFETSSGTDLDFFFDQWVYDEYWPFYYYNFTQNSDNVLHLVIHQAQEELYGYRPVFEMPVRIGIQFETGYDTTVTVWNDQQTQYYSFPLTKGVSCLAIDPDKWILRKTQFDPELPVSTNVHEALTTLQVYPNPSGSGCQIKLHAAEPESTTMEIFHPDGRCLIRNHFIHPGKLSWETTWDGCDEKGRRAGPGTYILCITNGNTRHTARMVMTR